MSEWCAGGIAQGKISTLQKIHIAQGTSCTGHRVQRQVGYAAATVGSKSLVERGKVQISPQNPSKPASQSRLRGGAVDPFNKKKQKQSPTMIIKRQMRAGRCEMFQSKLNHLEAQVELAITNFRYFDQLVTDLEAEIAVLSDEQDEEEERRDNTQEQLKQMRQKLGEKERFWEPFWKSKILHDLPGTRKNTQKRENFWRNLNERKEVALYEVNEEEQESLEEDLTDSEERLQKIAEESYEKDIKLEVLQETLDFHRVQCQALTTLRNNEIIRRINMYND